ncbi:MAG: S-layer homology domain-containing protein [Oscillospiraceae bacterium]|jgi:hypothetical protein
MKKFMKHVLPLLLIVCLVVALGCTAFATDDFPFTDVPENSWYYDYVNAVYQAGIMKGVSETEFAPHATMTRAMLVTVLYRLIEEDPSTDYPTSGFYDVANDQWYTEAVDWGVYNGFISGVEPRYFHPDDPVSREQAAALFFRIASAYVWVLEDGSEIPWDNGARADLSRYPDANNVFDYAKEAFQWAVANDIIEGTTASENDPTPILAPGQSATRAQVAAIIVRFVIYLDNL